MLAWPGSTIPMPAPRETTAIPARRLDTQRHKRWANKQKRLRGCGDCAVLVQSDPQPRCNNFASAGSIHCRPIRPIGVQFPERACQAALQAPGGQGVTGRAKIVVSKRSVRSRAAPRLQPFVGNLLQKPCQTNTSRYWMIVHGASFHRVWSIAKNHTMPKGRLFTKTIWQRGRGLSKPGTSMFRPSQEMPTLPLFPTAQPKLPRFRATSGTTPMVEMSGSNASGIKKTAFHNRIRKGHRG